MRVLILGYAGFIGRSFTRRFLLRKENEVVGVDNLSAGRKLQDWDEQPINADNLTEYHMDCRRLFANERHAPDDFDYIIHCAANVGGRVNIDGDPLNVATNMSIDSEFFNWAVRGKKLPRVVYFSSAAVYPIELQTRQTHCQLAEALQGFESTRVGMPDKTYGYAKLTGEYLAKFAREQYGLRVNVYRPFGGYGPSQDFSYPFPSIIRRIVDREDPVVVWGSGEQKRDFIYVDDVVEAVLSTMTWDLPGPLNLGTGVATSFFELAQMAADVLAIPVTLRCDKTKPEGVFYRVADTRLMEHCMVRPSVSLKEGIYRVAKALQKSKSHANF